ncbi:MAG: hypothetical protein II101_01810, partial [Ruminococcus sp.]|nr:hypothetical protein [Ruminococcus sp.]
ARKGVKKIFAAELITLFVSLASGFLLIFFESEIRQLPQTIEGLSNGGSLEMNGWIVLIVIGLAGVLSLFASLINLIGYIQASRDETSFLGALIFMLLNVVLSGFATFFQQSSEVFAGVFTISASIAELFMIILTVKGLVNLSYNLNSRKMVARGNVLLRLIAVICLLSVVAEILVFMFRLNVFVTSLLFSIMITNLVLSLVYYIIYLVYLSGCCAMLSER